MISVVQPTVLNTDFLAQVIGDGIDTARRRFVATKCQADSTVQFSQNVPVAVAVDVHQAVAGVVCTHTEDRRFHSIKTVATPGPLVKTVTGFHTPNNIHIAVIVVIDYLQIGQVARILPIRYIGTKASSHIQILVADDFLCRGK